MQQNANCLLWKDNKMRIETERLLLRPFQEGDAEDVFEYLKEPAVNCFADMKLNSIEEARQEVLKRSSETEYYFAIEYIWMIHLNIAE
jgi:RimJ/RimL family protein N-acetyltransferase